MTINARVLALALIAELCIIMLFDLGSLINAADGISLEPLMPDRLFVDGVGGVFALGMAAFVGYESGPVFGEEARGPRAVPRATFAALAFLGFFYAFSAWALAIAVGPDQVVDTARDPAGGLPFSVLEASYGPVTGRRWSRSRPCCW